jgi:hypothetical protein
MPELAGVLLLVPSYLTGDQVRTLAELGQNAGLPVTGAVSRTVAAGLSSYTEQPWHNIGIVVDVDEHALICSVLRAGDLELTSLGQRVIPELGLRVWRERLVACVSDLCIRSTRRDPRESPEADQLMFDQLDHVFDQGSQGKSTHVQLQGLHWYQSLRVEAADADAACRGLVGQVVLQIQAALAWAEQHLTTASVYFTANAARLPGLVAECQKHGADRVPVTTLGAAVPAQAAFELGLRIQRGELPAGFFATAASLPNGDRPDSRPVLPFPERKARTASGPT